MKKKTRSLAALLVLPLLFFSCQKEIKLDFQKADDVIPATTNEELQ